MGSVGRIAETITQAQEKTLRDVARKTADLKNEQYRIIDKDGNVVIQKQGRKTEVTASVGEKRQYLDGAISIHNHPDDNMGGTFSTPDLRDFGYGATEIWVTAHEGTYRLINTKVGTMEQKDGWVALRDAIESQPFNREWGYLELRDKAKEAPHIKALSERISALSAEWVERRNAGASKETLDSLVKQYDAVSEQYKKAVKKEMRRIEVEPYHEFMQQNASKYGFKYVFEPRKRRK